MLSIVLLAAWLVLPKPLESIPRIDVHSWYPGFCCNEQDCHPVPCEEIDEGANGADWDGYHFRKDRVFPSQDAQCHACIGGKGVFAPRGMPYCIFTQQGS